MPHEIRPIRRALPILAALLWAATGAPAHAAQLVVLERAGCIWCARFEAEIAPIYPKTPEAAAAPLRRVDLDGKWPADLPRIDRVLYTPTFVLFDRGRVVGQVRGYPGDVFFWPAIDDLIAKLPAG